MMIEQNTFEQFTKIFHQVFDDDTIVLKPETTANDVTMWDSFNHISLIVAVEAHFGIKFHTAEIEELKNVGDFVEAIAYKVKAKR